MSDIYKPKHCWFSQKMWEQNTCGLHPLRIYYDIAGQRTEVTVVSETMDHGCGWDDIVYLGQGTWIQTIRGWA